MPSSSTRQRRINHMIPQPEIKFHNIRLQGSILGSQGTGKTALFQRLRGKDPFEQPIRKKTI